MLVTALSAKAAGVPPLLTLKTVKAATALVGGKTVAGVYVSARAAALAAEALPPVLGIKGKLIVVLLALALAGSGGSLALTDNAPPTVAAEPAEAQPAKSNADRPAAKAVAANDRYGDPLAADTTILPPSGVFNGSDIRLWDAATGQLIRRLPDTTGQFAISPDGKGLQGKAAVNLFGTVNGQIAFSGAIKLALDGTLAGQGAITISKSVVATLGTAGTGAINVKGGTLLSTAADAAYSGTVTLKSGTIQVSAADNGLGTGALRLIGGTLQDISKTTVTLANPLIVAGNDTVSATKGLLVFSQDVTLSSAGTMTLAPASQVEFASTIGGSGKLTVTSTGPATLELPAPSKLLTIRGRVKLKII